MYMAVLRKLVFMLVREEFAGIDFMKPLHKLCCVYCCYSESSEVKRRGSQLTFS